MCARAKAIQFARREGRCPGGHAQDSKSLGLHGLNGVQVRGHCETGLSRTPPMRSQWERFACPASASTCAVLSDLGIAAFPHFVKVLGNMRVRALTWAP